MIHHRIFVLSLDLRILIASQSVDFRHAQYFDLRLLAWAWAPLSSGGFVKSEMSDLTKKLVAIIHPLKPKEEKAAIQTAKAHVAKELSDHYRVVGAELRINKPSEGKIERMLSVLILDYGNRRNFEVLVNTIGKVVRIVDLRGAQPAYTSDEIKEARRIAEQDSRLAHIAKIKGSFVSEFGPEHAADNARRVGLRYAAAEKRQVPRVVAHAIVDLSGRKLVHVDTAGAEQRQEK